MSTRVVHWGTGNVGKQALRGIIANPTLELAGVLVSNPAKVGVDAASLAGTDEPTGVAATADVAAAIDSAPDCVVYTAMTDDRIMESLQDLARLLSAGINVVASGPVFLQYPFGVVPDEMIDPVVTAAREGGASLFVNGIDPGFANDLLPLALTGTCARIDQVRCMEIVDYATYDNPAVLFEIMGFGKPMSETPFLLTPGILTTAWGSVVRQIAAGLELRLDEVTEVVDRRPAPETFSIASGTIEEGTAAALRFEVRGMVGGHAAVVLEHVTRLRADLMPEWPQPAGQDGSYRVEITGEPSYTVDLAPHSAQGDHNHAALVGTAMRLVNAVPTVVDAPAGLLTTLDLPLITGKGLVS